MMPALPQKRSNQFPAFLKVEKAATALDIVTFALELFPVSQFQPQSRELFHLGVMNSFS